MADPHGERGSGVGRVAARPRAIQDIVFYPRWIKDGWERENVEAWIGPRPRRGRLKIRSLGIPTRNGAR